VNIKIGQVVFSLGESGANIEFPIGEVMLGLNITSKTNGYWLALKIDGKTLFNGAILESDK